MKKQILAKNTLAEYMDDLLVCMCFNIVCKIKNGDCDSCEDWNSYNDSMKKEGGGEIK